MITLIRFHVNLFYQENVSDTHMYEEEFGYIIDYCYHCYEHENFSLSAEGYR